MSENFEWVLGRLRLGEGAEALFETVIEDFPARFARAPWRSVFHDAEGRLELPSEVRVGDALERLSPSLSGGELRFVVRGAGLPLELPIFACAIAEEAARRGHEVELALLGRQILDAETSVYLRARGDHLEVGQLSFEAMCRLVQLKGSGGVDATLAEAGAQARFDEG